MRKTLLIVAALGAAGYGLYHHQSATPKATAQKELVEDRLWIDHMPRNERDTFQVFATLGEESMGVFQATSAWKGAFEIFRYEGHGGELRVVFPQNGDRETIRAKATACKQNGWDYCLQLDGGSRGVKRYFSMEDWEIGSLRDVDAKIKDVETRVSDPSSARK